MTELTADEIVKKIVESLQRTAKQFAKPAKRKGAPPQVTQSRKKTASRKKATSRKTTARKVARKK